MERASQLQDLRVLGTRTIAKMKCMRMRLQACASNTELRRIHQLVLEDEFRQAVAVEAEFKNLVPAQPLLKHLPRFSHDSEASERVLVDRKQ